MTGEEHDAAKVGADEMPRVWNSFRIWAASFALFTILGVVWAISSPMMSVPDEPSHTVRAVAIVRGQVFGDEVVVRQHDPGILNGITTTVIVPKGFSDLADERTCFAFYPDRTAACAPPFVSDSSPTPAVTFVGRYPPGYYAFVGIPSLIFAPFQAFWAMRALSVVASSAMLALAVVALGDIRRGGMVVAGLALSVTPMVLYLSAAINPNGLEIAAAIATWVSVLALATGSGIPSRGLIIRSAVCVSVFLLTRPLSPVFALTVIGTVWLAFGTRTRARELWSSQTFRRTLVPVGIVFVAASAWVVLAKSYDAQMGYPTPNQTTMQLITTAWQATPMRLQEMFGLFGWFDTKTPDAAAAVWGGLLMIMVVLALVFGRWRERLAILALAAATIVMPIAGDVLSAANVGQVWQGRYNLPLSVGLPLVAALAVDRSRRLSPGTTRLYGLVTVTLAGVIYLVCYAVATRRYSVGANHPVLEHLTVSEWQPYFGQVPTFVATVIAVVAFLAGSVWLVLNRTAMDASVGD